MTKDVKETSAYGLLIAADSAKALTDKGEKLKAMVTALQLVEKGKTKYISAEGVAELNGLGERMNLYYPNIFKGRPNLHVALTKRCAPNKAQMLFCKAWAAAATP